MKERVHIMEVTPRDGLQNEKFMPTHEEKRQIIEKIVDCGFRQVEAGSFVHPKAVPQMAGTAELFSDLPKAENVDYYALIPNLKGYELALKAGVKNIGYVLAVTEEMQQRNVRMSVEEGYRQLREIARLAEKDGVKLRGYLAVVFHCPFEGETPTAIGLEWVKKLAELGISDICLADTDGNAQPDHAEKLLTQALKATSSYQGHLSLHLHQTYGYAEENLRRALKAGIRHLDAATAGLGGCPFAPGAKGNIASERLVAICEEAGYATGIDRQKLSDF
ncbi:MAG: hydroxymethylglutaryl-CoA lyase, partial [Cyclobacteriaceae bacterium]